MSGGKSKSTSKSYSGSGQLWAQPYATAGASSVQGVFNQNQPGLQGLTNTVQNNLVPTLQGKFNSSLSGANSASDYNKSVLAGNYMNGNPYINDILGRVRSDVSNDVNSVFARSGRYGSMAHQNELVDRLSQAESGLLYQNYGDEMARRDAAAASLTSANQQDFNQTLGAIGMGAELPYTGANSLANSLGALFSGGTETTKQKQGGGLLSGILGAGAQIGSAAIMASDPRVKTDAKMISLTPDGLGIYDYRFKKGLGLPRGRQIGVMADEVAMRRPDALGPNVNGIQTVNYARL